jgi:hypothetical protein
MFSKEAGVKVFIAAALLVMMSGLLGCGQEKIERVYTPGLVVILRHGEKPETGPELSARGRERAAALVEVFRTRPELNVNGKPAVIYAMKPGGDDMSRRPMETVEPTSKALGIPMVTRYTHLEYDKVVREVFGTPAYEGKTVVVCWEHHVIPDLAKAFGVKKAPEWHGKVFDEFWLVTYEGEEAKLTVVGEGALAGDRR